jgi:hypothetical protein
VAQVPTTRAGYNDSPTEELAKMNEPTYMGEEQIVARIGDVVMAPGNLRGIVIALNGTFVRVLAIGTSKETGDTFVLPQRSVDDYPASQCYYMEKQVLNLF